MTHRNNRLSQCIGLTCAIALLSTVPGCSSGSVSGSFRSSITSILESDTLSQGLTSAPLTQEEVADGLKDALRSGVRYSTSKASSAGGYLNDPQLHIPIPPTLGEFPVHLRKLGFGSTVDQFELTLNRAAEEAARTAAPIFLDALRKLTVYDAWEILQGEDDAATRYLREKSESDLYAAFLPEVTAALDSTGCTRIFKTLTRNFNQIPGLEDVTLNLDSYTTIAAVKGLFILIAQEEKNIRENPRARTTELMQRVFAPKMLERS